MVQLNEMSLTCRGGGSLVNKAPIYSNDSRYIYVIWKKLIYCYNTENGDKVIEYTGLEDDIVNMYIHPVNANLITACSVKGHIMTWNIKTAIDIFKAEIPISHVIVNSFHILSPKKHQASDDASYRSLISYTNSTTNNDDVQFGIFNTKKRKFIPISLKMKRNKFHIAVGGARGNEYFGITKKNKLYFGCLDTKEVSKYCIELPRKFTCIACHPEEVCIATGDTTGRIVVWNNLGSRTPSQAVYHWHTLPVNTITFSQSGSYFYSGGGECVVVKWVLNNPSQKQFAARLPAAVTHLSISPQNIRLAISLANNGIHILNSSMNLVCLIQHLVWGNSFSAGIHLDPRSKSLVLNGYIGHVQFYSLVSKNLLYNLDIVGQNKFTNERNIQLENIEVTKITINSNGLWLGTVEERSDKKTTPEIRLKFWQFDAVKQTFVLNTSVEWPHEVRTLGIKFQPNSTLETVRCVTIGGDCKFKIWSLIDTDSIYKTGKVWTCTSIGHYRNLPTNALNFSVDGSLLGIAFDDILTAWAIEPCELKCSLIHPNIKSPIKQIQFGTSDQCHLVVTVSENRVSVWNLLTLTVVWTVSVQVDVLCVDPISTYMAAFTNDSQLFVFCPSSPTPIYHMSDLYKRKDCKVVSALFVPRISKFTSGQSWQQNSKLYFMDTNQELYTLDEPKEGEFEAKLAEVTITAAYDSTTPFGTMLAKSRNTEVSQSLPVEHLDLGISADLQLKQFLDIPVHAMAPVRVLCAPLLESLVLSNRDHINRTKSQKQNSVEKNGPENESNKSEDVESEDEEFLIVKKRREKHLAPPVARSLKKEDLQGILHEQLNFMTLLLSK